MKPNDWLRWATDYVRTVGVTNCHDCDAKPGEPHKENCDTERCSVCGGQRLCCNCEGHDPMFARWTGFWPGKLESIALGIDLNELAESGFANLFFVKPNTIVHLFVKPDTIICHGQNLKAAREAAKRFWRDTRQDIIRQACQACKEVIRELRGLRPNKEEHNAE